MLVILKTFDILNPNTWKTILDGNIQIYICVCVCVCVGFEKKSNNYTKYKVIKLNIYIFNAFVVKILITNLTFGDKVHKSKNI
jgi:hypothetical protein